RTIRRLGGPRKDTVRPKLSCNSGAILSSHEVLPCRPSCRARSGTRTFVEDGKAQLQQIQAQLAPLADNMQAQLKPLAENMQAQLKPLVDNFQAQMEDLFRKVMDQTKSLGQ
uniref:Uncharacterized protein n=1 Tax=Oncorhynchus tshawytscha TaxID=74940 RepID=A0A8C8CNL4_ONCTS